MKISPSIHSTCAPLLQIPKAYEKKGDCFSPCNMNLSASQHTKTPPARKRLFVKVQSTIRGLPENKKEDHPLPISKGALRWQSLNLACVMQEIRALSCDPPRKPETKSIIASDLNSSGFFCLIGFALVNPEKIFGH